MSARKFLLLSFFFILSINIFAQNTVDAVKEKLERETKLLEQILADAKSLRLPENRALVFAKVGNAYWKIDEKQARKLFQDSVSEIIAAQDEVQNLKPNKQFFHAILYGQSPRVDIITLIGARDAEMALELLIKSRPAAISEAIKNPNNDSTSMLQQYARNEISVEQRLFGLAADQNPQIALRRVRESLKKGISYDTLTLLRKIYAKDPEAAKQLADEVVESLLSTDLSKNSMTFEIIGNFVADIGRQRGKDEKDLQISETSLRNLVSKMIDNWLEPKNNIFYGYWSSKAVVERLFPDRAAKVKQKVEKYSNQNDESEEYNKLLSAETSPEELIANAAKFSPAYRNELYRSAANKLAQAGNINQAEKIIQANISEDQAENYISQLYINLSNQSASLGKFDEANNFANQIPDEYQRINAYIGLANQVYQKDPKENQKWAERILNQARSLLPDTPETQNDLNAVTYLATGFVSFNPDESFRLIESLLPTLNELIQANFVLTKFRSYGATRQNEMQISNAGSLGFYNLDSVLKLLKEKDFERTLQFTNGFNRLEIKICWQLQLIDENLQLTENYPINLSRSKIDG